MPYVCISLESDTMGNVTHHCKTKDQEVTFQSICGDTPSTPREVARVLNPILAGNVSNYTDSGGSVASNVPYALSHQMTQNHTAENSGDSAGDSST